MHLTTRIRIARSKTVRSALAAALTLSAAIAAGAAIAANPPPGSSSDPQSVVQAFPKPDRPVAGVVSASWGDEAARDHADEVGQISVRLGLHAGMTVADIGAGDGYDSLRLSRLLGPTGHVVAEDVTPAYVEALKGTIQQRRLTNVTVILGDPDDPHLAPSSLDAVIMVHMYHEITDPYGLLYRLAPALKAGGKVGVEELDRPTGVHGTPPALLRCEFKASGYQLVSLAPLKGGLGYLAVFSAPAPEARPRPSAIRPCHG